MHFVGLVNVANLKAGGLGNLGDDQLAWLEDDLKGRSASTPIVVFAHIPLWAVYPDWGWGTDDGAQALGLLKRFGSVTVLNGHIHQIMQKVEGNVDLPHRPLDRLPAAGARHGALARPDEGADDKLRAVLGIASVKFMPGQQRLAIVDHAAARLSRDDANRKTDSSTEIRTEATMSRRSLRPALLAGLLALALAARLAARAEPAAIEVKIDNFTFVPQRLTVKAGTTVTWINEDDIPAHGRGDRQGVPARRRSTPTTNFRSPSRRRARFEYFCSLAPAHDRHDRGRGHGRRCGAVMPGPPSPIRPRVAAGNRARTDIDGGRRR